VRHRRGGQCWGGRPSPVLPPITAGREQSTLRSGGAGKGVGNPSSQTSSSSKLIFLGGFPTADSAKLPPTLLCLGP